MKTYIQICKDKKELPTEDSFDDFVEKWHTQDSYRNVSLAQAIGVTDEEYGANFLKPPQLIALLTTKVQES